MQSTEATVRQMSANDLKLAIDWAAAEGWNPGLADADAFWQTDPEGFLAIDCDGKMVGSVSVVSYGGDFGFLGLLIVKPEFRGKRLGDRLFKSYEILRSRLHRDATIGLDGVFTMQAYYGKNGFKYSHRNLRMEGVGKAERWDKQRISPITGADFEPVSSFDSDCFGFRRRGFLQYWLSMPDCVAFKYIDKDAVRGYGVIRKCRRGWKIGPLFAATFVVARELFKALNSACISEPFFLDVPEINKNAIKLAAENGLKECFGCARMYMGEAPALPYRNIYGVTTFELG